MGYSYSSSMGKWTSSYNSNSHEIYIKFKTGNSFIQSSEEEEEEEEEEKEED